MRGLTHAWAALLVWGCAGPTVVAPPGAPVVEVGVGTEGVVLRVPPSPDDAKGEGLRLVSSYTVLRATGGDNQFAPFHYEELPREEPGAADGPSPLRIRDLSATPGEIYRYRAYGMAEHERATVGRPGALASASEPSAPVEVPPGAAPRPTGPPSLVLASPVQGDDGTHLRLSFQVSEDDRDGAVVRYEALRAADPTGPWLPFPGGRFAAGANVEPPEGVPAVAAAGQHAETLVVPGEGPFYFRVYAVPARGDAAHAEWSTGTSPTVTRFAAERLPILLVVLAVVVLSFVFLRRAQGGARMFVRRIPGVDAIEEAVGRATEMGRPVLYVPGIDEIQNIQTIASILVLGRVAEMIARYDAELRVPCCIPLVAAVSEEVVRQGFYDAGRPDAHRPQNVQWISSEQFAFCAGTNGIMMRDKPAANIYLGRFFAESLILAETGYVHGAVQVAGTAAIEQLPFFIAACDYTLIGEELFAVSAYMTHDPRLLSTLKAADWIKAACIALLLVGAVTAVVWPTSPLVSFLSDPAGFDLGGLLGGG